MPLLLRASALLFWLPVLLLSRPVVAAPPPPRLTLFVVVDSLSAERLMRSAPRLTKGFGPLMQDGAYYPVISYQHAETVTGPGHTTLSTGAHPGHHGIVSNEIFDRDTKKLRRIFSDPEYPVLEAPKDKGDVSPRAIEAEALADRLKLATDGRAKVVALAGKARAAMPLAGKLGQAFWFSETNGKFVTGTWYAKELPAWVKAFNAKGLPDSHFGKKWELSAPASSYAGEDALPYESDAHGLGRTFPHPLTGGGDTPGPEFYTALSHSPVQGELLVELARSAMASEELGRDEVPDLLVIGMSWVDRIFHRYGPDSWETQDALLRLDAQLATLVAAAEKAAGGKDKLLVVLSADHGSSAIPEALTRAGVPTTRLHPDVLARAADEALKTEFGKSKGGGLVLGVEQNDLFLDIKALAERKLDATKARAVAARALSSRPDIAIAATREELLSTVTRNEEFRVLQRGFHPARSGDILFYATPNAVLTDEKDAANHGTPYHSDKDVPLILRGAGVRKGRIHTEGHPVDVAPTVAALMRIGSPGQADGRVLHEVLVP